MDVVSEAICGEFGVVSAFQPKRVGMLGCEPHKDLGESVASATA